MRLKSIKISVFITEPLKTRLVNLNLKKASASFILIPNLRLFNKYLFLIGLFIGVISCSVKKDNNSLVLVPKNKYAKSFAIQKTDSLTFLHLINDSNITETYTITPSKKIKETKYRVVCLTNTVLPYLEIIDESNSIVGLADMEYLHPSSKVLENEKIVNIGKNAQYDIETILSLNPDFVFISPEQVPQTNRLKTLGIKTIIVSEYLENHPLGKLEWIKFISTFYHKEQTASHYLDSISKLYTNLTQIEKTTQKPTVFSGMCYNGSWSVSGGNSFVAQLITDAGGIYNWNTNKSSGTVQLEYESVLEMAGNTDFWRIQVFSESNPTYESLLKENKTFKNFKAFTNRKIVFVNTKKTDYFGKGIVEPHIILADLIRIFHPTVLPNHKATYYQVLDE